MNPLLVGGPCNKMTVRSPLQSGWVQGFGFRGFRVSGFRVSGFQEIVESFRFPGFGASGFRVSGFWVSCRVSGFRAKEGEASLGRRALLQD